MKVLLFFFIVLIFACKSTSKVVQKPSEERIASDESYGYSRKNPIKVGGVNQGQGPAAERAYLNALSGPNGESVWFEREGSCCAFDTPNSPFGKGMLDTYKVTYEGKKDTIILFINMYDKDKLLAPKGFKLKK
ncbi:MAG: hypothetical protein MUC49_13505 [Raineya sp.]|jgi:hypothetical protein|nr:hypothetical protein [Raineya sp.]